MADNYNVCIYVSLGNGVERLCQTLRIQASMFSVTRLHKGALCNGGERLSETNIYHLCFG